MIQRTTIFNHSYYNFHPIDKGETKRSIVELFLKIVCNFWRSLGSYFCRVTLNNETIELKNQKQAAIAENHSIQQTLSELEYKRTIGPTSIKEYVEKVLVPEHSALGFVPNFLFSAMNSKLPTRMEVREKNLIFIPVVLRSFGCDHIVSVVYDKNANCVELYDSKGFVTLDRGEWVRNSDQLKLNEVLMRVVEEYGNEFTTIWENTTKHQYDSHNCGIYVLDYIERRLGGESPTNIASNGLTFNRVNNGRREELISKYLTKLPLPNPNSAYEAVSLNQGGDDF